MRSRTEKGLDVLLTIAAMVLAGLAIRQAFVPQVRTRGNAYVGDTTPTYYKQWRGLLGRGIGLGQPQAAIQIIEFVDFECPVCRSFHQGALKTVQRRFGSQIRVTLLHLPLSIHRFAPIAARAVECADEQGAAAGFIDRVFERQDSLGLMSWTSFGARASLPDTAGFAKCVQDQGPVARIDSGTAIAERLEIRATPTVFLNGWRFALPPSSDRLSEAITSILAGKDPFGSKNR